MRDLHLYVPDSHEAADSGFDERRFCLRPIAGKTLIHHWIDYAVDRRCESVIFHVSRDAPEVADAVFHGGAWPIARDYRITDARMIESFGAVTINSLPGVTLPIVPSSEWELCDLSMELESVFLDDLFVNHNRNGFDPGVGSRCRIPDSVHLKAPYFIGDSVSIGENSVIGPYAVIGSGAVLGDNCSVQHARIESNTYLGNHTSLTDSILRGKRLLNIRNRVSVVIGDDFIANDFTHGDLTKSLVLKALNEVKRFIRA